MDSITQNWLWFALAFVGAGWVLFRFLHQAGRNSNRGKDDPRGGDQGSGSPVPSVHRSPASVIDPVSGHSVCTATAPAFFFQGRVYFFASVHSRDRFEAAPRAYVNSRRDPGKDSDATIHHAGRAQPARTHGASTGKTPNPGGAQVRPQSLHGRNHKQQGAPDGG